MIEANGLTMHYGSVVALADASFEVGKEEVVGLLGPNGAGKSTTMKILTTYQHPTAGTAKVKGHSILDDPIAVRQMTGYLPEVLPLYTNMEVAEYLDFVGRARGLSGARLKERVGYVTERCRLKTVYRRPIRELSKGYKQRTGLAQALIHDPEVLILDEPTSGLDPRQILDIRALIRELAETKTVILSTHILQEVQAMSDRIIIINQGRIVGQGTLQSLRDKAHETNRIRFAAKADKAEVDKALGGIGAIDKRALTRDDPNGCEYVLVGQNEGAMIAAVGELAKDRSWQITELSPAPYTLEETFLALTETEAGVGLKGGAA